MKCLQYTCSHCFGSVLKDSYPIFHFKHLFFQINEQRMFVIQEFDDKNRSFGPLSQKIKLQ